MVDDTDNNDRTQSYTPIPKGTVISRYRIVQVIGVGGMGEVYLAEDTELNRTVALKFLPHYLISVADAKARFKREAQAAAGLKHPNIVTIYEVGEFEGRPFFAMEHCEGQSLRDALAEKTLPISQIVNFSIQICDGLQEAHSAGVIHRDIKPSNIVIDKNGRPKLVDFGLATVPGAEKLTKTGSTLGTVGYMSPEQIEVKDIDHRSDLFSFGVLLYEMIAGRTPFPGETEAAIIKSVIGDAPEPLARYKSDIPDQLQRIISKLLEKNRELRYQSAAGVIPDLKKLSIGRVAVAKEPKRDWWNRYVVAGAAIVIVVLAGYWILTRDGPQPVETAEPERKMLAVLPFENLGAPEDEYFADGITDEIISRLASLHGLGIISRTSTLQYKGTTKNLRDIGVELGADYILEGTIRWDRSGEESRVRINPQLIHAVDDIHLWADRYDEVIDDIFAVQSSIAERVIEALGVTLLESEQLALHEQPTDNTEAYDLYLRGREYLTLDAKDLKNAETLLNRAIELAPDFGQAYAYLGFVHTQMYWAYHDRTEQRLKAAKEAIDRAFAINPDLPEAHGVLGWYYYHGFLDYDQALREFSIAREMRPGNSRVIYSIALIERRQGKWDDALQSFAKAYELDPRSLAVCIEYAGTLVRLRRYAEADVFYDRALTWAPDAGDIYSDKAWASVRWKGDTKAAHRVLQEALQRANRRPELTYLEVQLNIIEGDYEQALRYLTSPGVVSGHEPLDSADYYNLKGDVYRHAKQIDFMMVCYDSARSILERMVAVDADDPVYHTYLSWAYAGLARKKEAVREAKRAVEILPLTKDAVRGAELTENLALMYAVVGEHDLAIEQLEFLLSIPSGISVPYLKIWPDYAPLLDHPRFQVLLEKYDKEND